MSRRLLAAGLVLLGVLAGCGKGKEKESQVQEWVKTLNETADALATVKDEASAKSAAPKLKQLFEKEKELQNRVNSGEKLSKAEADSLAQMRPQVEAARQRRESELKRVSAMPGVREILKDALVPRSWEGRREAAPGKLSPPGPMDVVRSASQPLPVSRPGPALDLGPLRVRPIRSVRPR